VVVNISVLMGLVQIAMTIRYFQKQNRILVVPPPLALS
jgi:hypothetical protein